MLYCITKVITQVACAGVKAGIRVHLIFAARLMTAIMGMVTTSVLTTIMILHLHHHSASRRPPRWMRTLAFNCLARIFCMPTLVTIWKVKAVTTKQITDLAGGIKVSVRVMFYTNNSDCVLLLSLYK